jgi:4-hydroxy-tetrahydrodipicolinate synthase
MPAGAIDLPRLVEHAGWVLANGADGITLFGTTGEGASVGVSGRHAAFGALAGVGLDMRSKVVSGISAAAREDVVAQMRAAYDHGCRGLLLAPPFYFHGAGDDGLYAFFSQVFEEVGGALRDVILYHIPGMTGVPVSIELVHRLDKTYPGRVIGVKDSAGDWVMTERRLKELPGKQVLIGDERQLARAVRHGGAGSICGLANVAPDLLHPLAHEGKDDARINQMVEAVLNYSFMPAIKALVAERLGDPAWRVMRPPLEALSAADGAKLGATMAAIRRAAAA